MKKLNKKYLRDNPVHPTLQIPDARLLELPNKVLQFGTGVLLRGLPDFIIDRANREGNFNGRIVVVKSTKQGNRKDFSDQDSLYTLHSKGILNGEEVKESFLISAIDKVLVAQDDWPEVLQAAISEELQVIISNTTEQGITFSEEAVLTAHAPASFPGKLTAVLYERFQHFKGDVAKGLTILPTELIDHNADHLKSIILQLAHSNRLGADFINWVQHANNFCNTLVDRIVPGKLSALGQEKANADLGYTDELAIMTEPFYLWAIEAHEPGVAGVLSFAQGNKNVIIAPDISKFKELKLRLLNGTHTFSCALAILAGFKTVKQAMQNTSFRHFLSQLMRQEIIPAMIGGDLSEHQAIQFSNAVVDRFSNPYLDHQWESIAANYTSKMTLRNGPLIDSFHHKNLGESRYMALGYAAYLVWLKGGKDAIELNTYPHFQGAVKKYRALLKENGAMHLLDKLETTLT